MKQHFKEHVSSLKRYQTSLGRDLVNGYRLDRNEKVSNFSDSVMKDTFRQFTNYSLSASPESSTLYNKIANSINIRSEKIYITNGITEGIKLVYETLTNPGDNIIVLDPTYPMYMIYAKLYQLEYRKFSYLNNNLPDWDSLFAAMDKKTKIVAIPNPNLPIESVFTVDEIKKIATACKNNNTILAIDEAYHFFGAPSVLDLIDDFDNLIVFRTFSKAYGLAAIRLGFMVSQKDNIQYFMNTRSIVESNTLSMKVAEYFLDHQELRDNHVKEVKEGAKYIQSELDSMGIRWHGGNYTNGILLFLDSQDQSAKLVKEMKQKKIYIRGSFEPPYDSCVRISLGHIEAMKVFIKVLKELLA